MMLNEKSTKETYYRTKRNILHINVWFLFPSCFENFIEMSGALICKIFENCVIYRLKESIFKNFKSIFEIQGHFG